MVKFYIDKTGNRWYEQDNRYHRLNGPSLICSSGYKYWYRRCNCYSHLHRTDGPALESPNANFWYYNGSKIECSTQEEFERIIKLRLLW